MRAILKLFLAVSLLTSAAISNATPSCPSISTAISEIDATTLTATTSTTAPFHYSGTSTFDSSTVDYYSNAQPTTVTPTQQLKRLAPALKTGIPLSVASNSTSVACAYLGSATGTAPDFIPTFDAWNQVIVITSSGSGPTPPPPPPPGPTVSVSVNITGLPADAVVNVTMTSATNTFTNPVIAGTHVFAAIPADTYTVSAAAYQDYTASIPVNPVTISVTNSTVAINYSKAGPPTPTPTPLSGEVIYSVIFPVVP